MPQQTVEIETADGVCPVSLSIPEGGGRWPAIILYPDAGGMRDTKRAMGARLSALGYIVLVPDIYYRGGPYDVDMSTVFTTKEGMDGVISRMRAYTPDLAVRDADAFISYLDALPEKAPGGVGTTGYCNGGRLSLLAAGTLGDRVAAAASFHGGGLANPTDPDSPHLKAGAMTATLYIACAIEDRTFPDEQREALEAALTEAGVSYTLETYPALHGFAVPDHVDVYDEAAGERHWQATEAFFAATLGA